MKKIVASNGLTVFHGDGNIIGVLRNGISENLREEGFATVSLMAAVEVVCKDQNWPDWAIKKIINGCMHGSNIGLYGQIEKWKDIKEKWNDLKEEHNEAY